MIKMCELLGVNCNKAVKISLSLPSFEKNSVYNPHGWGIGFYRQSTDRTRFVTIIKEPIRAIDSIFTDFIRDNIRSDMFVSHIRYTSVGSQVNLNTHPYELMLDPRPGSDSEKSWIFAHNGTIPREMKKDRDFESPVSTHGNTDSEYAFCYIIGQLRNKYRENGYYLDEDEKISIVERAANRICDKFPFSLNFVMSDGQMLYAYCGGGNGLYYTTRKPPYKLEDKGDGMKVSFSPNKLEDEIASIVATTPLTDEDWIEFSANDLKVFKNGKMIYGFNQ